MPTRLSAVRCRLPLASPFANCLIRVPLSTSFSCSLTHFRSRRISSPNPLSGFAPKQTKWSSAWWATYIVLHFTPPRLRFTSLRMSSHNNTPYIDLSIPLYVVTSTFFLPSLLYPTRFLSPHLGTYAQSFLIKRIVSAPWFYWYFLLYAVQIYWAEMLSYIYVCVCVCVCLCVCVFKQVLLKMMEHCLSF